MCRLRAYLRLSIVMAILGSVLCPTLDGARKSDWVAVKQLVQGQEIRIVVDAAKSQVGEFRAATDDAIVIHVNTDDHAFSRPTVRRVSAKAQGHRRRNALIGAAIGVAAGLGIGAAVDRCRPSGFVCTGNKGKAIGTPLFAALGAAIGAILPAGQWQTIYQSQ